MQSARIAPAVRVVTLAAFAPLLAAAACGGHDRAVGDGCVDPGCASIDGDGGAPAEDAASASGDAAAPDASATRDGGRATGDAAAPPASSGVRILVEPSDGGAALVAAIRGATKSVHVTMYLLTSTDVLDALVAAKARTPDVKVLLNKTFPSQAGSNQAAFDTLQANHIDVAWAPSTFTYTHEKCVIVDGKEAWIMTMNATKSSATQNREYLAIDDDLADVAEAEAIFQADFAGASVTPTGKLVVAPVNARDAILAVVASATKTIDVEGEELSDYKIAAALGQAAQAGVRVRAVVAAGSTSTSQQQAIAIVKQGGGVVVATSTPYIHAKALVADGARAYVGSANFSTGSLSYNRELGVVIDAAAEVAKVASAIQTDFAAGAPQ